MGHQPQMVHLENCAGDETELENEKEIAKAKKKKKRLKKPSLLGVRKAFLGYCPMCDGEVYGAVDSAKCIDCGWTNKGSKYGWG